ncbi:MAG: hypothetical protein ACF8MJ_02340 [Phycisphaerales bacterium JB050]
MNTPTAPSNESRKKPRQPIAYTVGAPIAVVLFIALLIGATIAVRSKAPTGSERREQEQKVVEVLRTEMPQVVPPDNTDLTGVTIYAEAALEVVTIRVHGVMSPRLQNQIADTLREARAEGVFGNAVLRFHYPEARPEGLDPDSPAARIPIHNESPQPFREIRL